MASSNNTNRSITINNTNGQLSIRQLAKVLKKLNVRDGDVILVKSKTLLATKESVDIIIEGLKKLGHTRSLVMVVDDFDEVAVMNETDMNKQGWYRARTLLSKVHKENVDAPRPND